MNRWYTNLRKALVFAVCGALGGAAASLLAEVIVGESEQIRTQLHRIISSGSWFGIIGACIGPAILAGYAFYMKHGFRIVELLTGALVGLVAGAAAGGIAQYLFEALGADQVVRVICWAIAGGLLGLGLSFRIPNLVHWHGLAGGAVGGAIGGIVFILLTHGVEAEQALARLSGIAMIGFFIGLMVVLVEAAFREAWLEVRYGPKETRTISLGVEPVSIGGDAKVCTVYARSTPAVAFRYKLDQGRITCEDVAKGQTTSVQPGTTHTIGNLTVTVQAAGAVAQTATAAQPSIKPKGGFSLRLSNGKIVALADGVKLSTADIPGLQASTAGGHIAEVGRNPNDPTIFGLKNLSRMPWTATLANRDRVQVEPGRNVRIAAGTRISFGSVDAEIE